MRVAHWEEGRIPALRIDALEQLGGVRALFSGRRGGVSPRWQAGLNWSHTVGDEPALVRANRRRTLALVGIEPEAAIMAGLVHGDRVVAVTGDDPADPEGDVRVIPACDALITDRPGLALIATAADCVPVYLYDPVRRVIGIAHAGWRGTVARIAGKTVRIMAERFGCVPAQIHAVVGPSIGACCYEVDEQVAEPVRQAYPGHEATLLRPGRSPGKYQLDLWEANRLDLLEAGAGPTHVAGACTSCEVDRFFSHRAERGGAGRGAAVIVMY